ncbi:MAG: hypothetical protein II939_16930 [Bacteroidales bacterium]|nr:hypothetical protein [Bacteroidales bacterium]
MKRFFITTVLIIAAGTITNLSAQNANRYCSTIDNHDNGDGYSMPQGHKFPYNQEPTRTLDDYYNNNRQSNGKSNKGTSAHSGSSHNARSSNNNQSNHHNNSHTGTSNRSTRNSIHR